MPTLDELEHQVGRSGSAVVAFSGGVDSSLVAAVAMRVLGNRAIAVTAVSPALATGELDGARRVAAQIGIAHEVIGTDELARDGYRRNGADRCYHCKSELYDQLEALSSERGYESLFSGANVDDLGDWRPGLRAAAEHGVRHPLVEARFAKSDVRRVAEGLGVPSAAKPAMPCLASRIPFGTAVDPAVLAQIDRAELAVKRLGFGDLRVRHFGDAARVEIAEDDLRRALGPDRDEIEAAVLAAGYTEATVDTKPLLSGRLTTALRNQPELRRAKAPSQLDER
jgi:uncharacterized protein